MQRLLLLPITACLALREHHAESLSDLAAASLSDVAASLSDLASGEPGGFANRTRAGGQNVVADGWLTLVGNYHFDGNLQPW